MESLQHQLQEVEKKRKDLMPERQKAQKKSQKVQSIQDKRSGRKSAPLLSDKVDKNTMADAETEAELQGSQARKKRQQCFADRR